MSAICTLYLLKKVAFLHFLQIVRLLKNSLFNASNSCFLQLELKKSTYYYVITQRPCDCLSLKVQSVCVGRPLLMLQSIKRANRLEPESAALHSCLVRFLVFMARAGKQDPALLQVVQQETQPIFRGRDARQLNAQFLARHGRSLPARLEGECKSCAVKQWWTGRRGFCCWKYSFKSRSKVWKISLQDTPFLQTSNWGLN